MDGVLLSHKVCTCFLYSSTFVFEYILVALEFCVDSFSFIILKMLFYCLLPSVISDMKSEVIQVIVPQYAMCIFLWLLSQYFYLCFPAVWYDVNCKFIWNCKFITFTKMRKFSHYFIKKLILPHSLFAFQDSTCINAEPFHIAPQITKSSLIFF